MSELMALPISPEPVLYQSTVPVRASLKEQVGPVAVPLADSFGSHISNPGLEGLMSATCRASAWPQVEAYITVPLSLIVRAP